MPKAQSNQWNQAEGSDAQIDHIYAADEKETETNAPRAKRVKRATKIS